MSSHRDGSYDQPTDWLEQQKQQLLAQHYVWAQEQQSL
jgi:hypothetical protein